MDGKSGAGRKEPEGVVQRGVRGISRVRIIARESLFRIEARRFSGFKREQIVHRGKSLRDRPSKLRLKDKARYRQTRFGVQVCGHLRKSRIRVEGRLGEIARYKLSVEVEQRDRDSVGREPPKRGEGNETPEIFNDNGVKGEINGKPLLAPP